MQNDLCQNPLFSHQMICKQYIVLNHVFFQYESNLEIRTRYSKTTFHSSLEIYNKEFLKSNLCPKTTPLNI